MSKEYYWNASYVTIFAKIPSKKLAIVETYNGDLEVARLDSLVPKEESYTYKKQQEHKKELEQITAKAQKNLDKLTTKLVDKALKDLSFRMKFNTMFSTNLSDSAGWAVAVANELEKMIKEKAKDTIKESN